MEIIDFGTWETPEIGTKMIFHPLNKRSYCAVVVAVHGNEVWVERERDLEDDE